MDAKKHMIEKLLILETPQERLEGAVKLEYTAYIAHYFTTSAYIDTIIV